MIKNTKPSKELVKTAVMQSVIFPSDLRIGNLIGFGNSMCKVVEIQKNCFYVEDDEGCELKSTTCDLQPIKMNESVISEICFNENKVMGMYRLDATDNYSISFSLDNDMIYIGDDIEIRISETTLHRFQNIYFFLTARELTVA